MRLAAALLLASSATWGMSGSPTQFECDDPENFNALDKVQCYISEEAYTPQDLGATQPVAFIRPDPLPNDKSLQLKVKMAGYNARPDVCEAFDPNPDATKIVAMPCAGHYPDVALHNDRRGWWGQNLGPTNSYRIGLSLSKNFDWWGSVDSGAGVLLEGTSYGGTGAILQSFMLAEADVFWQKMVSTVWAQLPVTLFVRDHYPIDDSVQKAWIGYLPVDADIRTEANLAKIQNIYYRVNGSPEDTAVEFSTDFFREVCDAGVVSCFGTWHTAGHNISEPGINLPFYDLYTDPWMHVRLDQMLPIFTNSSANHWGSPGHYNLGLSYAVVGAPYFADTADRAVVPLKYSRWTDIGGGVPDQPVDVTFDFTLRRLVNFAPVEGEIVNWQLGQQGGTVVVEKDGEVTVRGITMTSSTATPGFVLTRPQEPVEPENPSIVYVRQPRDQTPVDMIDDASNWQHIPDIGSPFRHSASDIIIDDLNGNIEVVHDCTTTGEICAALTPRVSHDGNKILYTVAWGNEWRPVKAWGGPMTEMVEFNAHMEELWLYDVPTKTRRRLSTGHRDESADFIDGDSIVFVSDRADQYSAWTFSGNYYTHNNLQPYTADITAEGLTNLVSIAPHTQFAMNPMVAANGDICWVSWEGYGQDGQRGYTHTPSNQWWGVCADQDGANPYPFVGAHGSPYIRSKEDILDWVDPARAGEGATAIRGLRPIVELQKDVMALDNYYRGNSGGPYGNIFAFSRLPRGVEGVTIYNNYQNASSSQNSNERGSGQFIPSDLVNLTPYGNDQDRESRFHKDGRAAGRAGFPAPWPGEGWLYSHARGWCYEAADPYKATWVAMGGEPPCHKTIRLVPGQWPVNNPFDESQSTTIACADPQWHCWDARAVTTYQSLYGQAAPEVQEPTPEGQCWLQVVDGRKSELEPKPNGNPQDKISFQGNADENFTALMTDGGKFKIELIENWDVLPTRVGFKSQTLHSLTPLEADGSVKVNVPCETPFLMSGTDKNDNVIAIDNVTHSLRPGETRTCLGCHEAHSEERYAGYTETAEELFRETIAGQ